MVIYIYIHTHTYNKWSFPLRISSVNVTKCADQDFVKTIQQIMSFISESQSSLTAVDSSFLRGIVLIKFAWFESHLSTAVSKWVSERKFFSVEKINCWVSRIYFRDFIVSSICEWHVPSCRLWFILWHRWLLFSLSEQNDKKSKVKPQRKWLVY